MHSHDHVTLWSKSKNEIPKKKEKKIKSQQILPSCNCNKENPLIINKSHSITSPHGLSFLPFLRPELRRVRGIGGKYNKRDKYDKDENERDSHTHNMHSLSDELCAFCLPKY